MARRTGMLLALGAALALVVPGAQAHFRLNTSIRIVHLERLDDGIRLSMRLPATLAFAQYAGAPDELPVAGIPWVRDAVENGERVHYLDGNAIAADADGFADFVAGGYRLTADGRALQGSATALRIHAADRQTRFTDLDEVRASFAGGPVVPRGEALYVGDAVIDVRIDYPAPAPGAELRIANTLASTLPPDAFIANLLIGYDGDAQRIERVTGQLAEPVRIAPTRLSAMKSFLRHGFGHILGGPDHLLFVLCLAIGAGTIGALLWRVTGFTIGHTVSLAAGVAGYAPGQPWLVYTVEILVAASIIYAACTVLARQSREYTLAVTILIGILHGFGFSVLLAELLGDNSPHLVTSLLSFNLGIEAGQVLVVLLTLALMFSLGRISAVLRQRAATTFASVSLFIAAYWVLQRSFTLVEMVRASAVTAV